MQETNQEIAVSDNKLENHQQKPLELKSIFGFNRNVSILNLSTDSHSKIFAMASSHVLQIFRCDGNESKCFVGHEFDIFSLETDATGQFIVSADSQGIINVWSLGILDEFPHPVRTIYESHGVERLSKVAISFDAKVIITVCCSRSFESKFSVVKLWLWSDGQNYPHDVFEMPEKYDKVVNLRFSKNPKELSFFVITCCNGILFGQWESKTRKLHQHSPCRAISIHFNYVDTVFVENSDRAISITNCGSAVMWSNSITSDSNVEVSTYKKEFLKCVKLCDNPLKVIKSVDDSIVIADSNGHVRFYDKELKILFWFPSDESIDSVIAIQFDLNPTKAEPQKILGSSQGFHIRNFLIQTSSEILSVDFPPMKFSRIFFKSEDYVTAFDIFPLTKKQICCANYSGRLMIYDYEKNLQVIEYQLRLLRRRSLSSDVDVIEIPHVSSLAISLNGLHLIAGLDNGTIIILDPIILKEIRYFIVTQSEILSMKFSPDSLFLTIYDKNLNLIVLNHDKATEEEWMVVGGRTKVHEKPIVDYLYISKSSTLPPINSHVNRYKLNPPRLISLGEDRKIVEYDLNESLKDRSTKLNISFTKIIFQTSIPTAISLIYNSKKHEDQILIADNGGKFKIFDKNTFEIISTFMAPVYDSHVKQFDANTFAGLTPYSKYFVFSTEKYVGLYAMPLDGNMFRSLGVMGHSNGIKTIKVDSTRHFLFTLGHNCQSIFLWNINLQPIFDHLAEAGDGLTPYLHLIPGGQLGKFFKDMQNIFFYMLIVRSGNELTDQIVKEGLDANEISDFMRALGFYPTDYEIECINHEMQLNGKKRLNFEEVVKLFLNHSPAPVRLGEVETALRNLLNLNGIPSSDVAVNASDLIQILTEGGESVSLEIAKSYMKELLGSTNQIFMDDFLKNGLKLTDGFDLNSLM